MQGHQTAVTIPKNLSKDPNSQNNLKKSQ
jgi:hypothetical protein